MKRALWILLALQAVFSAPLPAETRWERSARKKQEITKDVVWPIHEPLMFYLRRGTHAEDWPQIYERQHAPDNVKRMAEADVRLLRLHFYKGFGLALETPEIANSQKMADLMHSYGMKVSLYVAGTLFAETFYHEVPEARSWEQRDQYNRWVGYQAYGTQTYRHYPCPNQPAYREYLKKVLKIGVESLKADQIFFDNVHLIPEPKSCRCPRCLEAFRQFLRQKYPTRDAASRRFGYPDVDYLEVNEWDEFSRPDALTNIDDPVLQEWVRFRCESLARHNMELYEYVKSLNPKVSVGFNLKGLYGINRMWLNGVYHPLFSGHCDFTPFDVTGMDPRIDPHTGALISEIRSYKMARRLNMSCDDSLADDLNCALYMAFNYQKPVPGFGHQGGPWLRGASNVFSPIIEFFREYNERYLTDVDNVADVAVLRSWPSMAYSVGSTLIPTILMEQVLIQHKIPFDILFDEQLDRIGRYAALILPGQESLSKDTIDRVLRYVREGGTLVFTGNTADYNEWREKRRVNPLQALVHSDGLAAATRSEEKGRIVYIPEIIPAQTRRTGSRASEENPEIAASSDSRSQRFAASDWVLPKNHQEIRGLIVDNLPQAVYISTEAPLTTVMEMVNRAKSRETIVHFVNFDRKNKLRPFGASLKKQFTSNVESVTYLSPEFDDPQPIEFKETSGRISFTVPATQVYGMIVVRYKS